MDRMEGIIIITFLVLGVVTQIYQSVRAYRGVMPSRYGNMGSFPFFLWITAGIGLNVNLYQYAFGVLVTYGWEKASSWIMDRLYERGLVARGEITEMEVDEVFR